MIKTSLWNGIAVGIKLLVTLVINKILAIYVGPSGYAVIGQFHNVFGIAVNLGGSILSTGVTQNTSKFASEDKELHKIWSTAVSATTISSICIGALVVLFSKMLSDFVLKSESYYFVFIALGVVLPAIVFNNILLAILNGLKEISTYVKANIIGSILSLFFVALLVYLFGIYGALLSIVVSSASVLFATWFMVFKRDWFVCAEFKRRLDWTTLRRLTGFGLMGIVSAIATPLSYIAIREILTDSIGVSAAGYWQACWKISEVYLLLVTSTLSVYYLPRLAEINTAKELGAELLKVYKFVVPPVIFFALCIYFFKDYIIEMLFSREFYPMRGLFSWQLAGDVIKICSWVLAYVMLGRAMVGHFIFSEILFASTFVLLTFYATNWFGLVGVSIAYLVNYIFYTAFMVIVVRREIVRMAPC